MTERSAHYSKTESTVANTVACKLMMASGNIPHTKTENMKKRAALDLLTISNVEF